MEQGCCQRSNSPANKWHDKVENIGDVTEDDISADFIKALSDDLNTPKAISILHQLDGNQLKASAQFMGLLMESKASFTKFKPASAEIDEATILKLIATRQEAKRNKDWALADKIRDDLLAQSVLIKDG